MISLAYDPTNCWSVITEMTSVKSRAELRLSDTPTVGSIAKSDWYGGKVEHYSYVIGIYEGGEVMVYECGVPKLHETGCGFRILGSSPNEEIIGYHNFK